MAINLNVKHGSAEVSKWPARDDRVPYDSAQEGMVCCLDGTEAIVGMLYGGAADSGLMWGG